MDIKYQIIFILNFLVCFLMMKALSWAFTERSRRPPFFSFLLGWPYLSPRSLLVKTPPPLTSPWLSLCLYGFLTGAIFALARIFLSPVGYFDRLLLGWGIYFFTESLGSLGQSLFCWRKEGIFPIHHHPLSSPSLSEFWGRRWNLWVQDWIGDMGKPFGRNRRLRILASFLISGLFHEAMVNLPHWISTGETYFGTMMAYFLFQAIGLFLDKHYLRHSPRVIRRVFCWLVVIIPSPLFINIPVLRFFGVTD